MSFLENFKDAVTVDHIEINRIEIDKKQPRKEIDDKNIKELSKSIEQHGLLNPIHVRKDDDVYKIIAGERRFRAFKQLGKKRIPAIILEDKEPKDILLKQIIENVQRENLSPVEEAEAYSLLIRDYGMSQKDVAKQISITPSHLNKCLKINSLNFCIKKELKYHSASFSFLYYLARFNDEKQLELWSKYKNGEITSRVELEGQIKEDKDGDSQSNQIIDDSVGEFGEQKQREKKEKEEEYVDTVPPAEQKEEKIDKREDFFDCPDTEILQLFVEVLKRYPETATDIIYVDKIREALDLKALKKAVDKMYKSANKKTGTR